MRIESAHIYSMTHIEAIYFSFSPSRKLNKLPQEIK